MGFGRFLRRVARVAIPAAIAYFTGGAGLAVGGLSAAQTAAAGSVLNSIAGGALSSQPRSSPITGVTQTAASAAANVDTGPTSAQVAEAENKKRLALNAAGTGGNTTTPLGVTSSANVTKRKLLGN